MSIDYSDMAFPKPTGKKKENHTKKAFSRVKRESVSSVIYSMAIILNNTQRNITSCRDPDSENYQKLTD